MDYSPGIFGNLLVVFIMLRLGGVVEWPWVVVMSPAWVPFCALILLQTIMGENYDADRDDSEPAEHWKRS